jgi:hypothetical protein
MVTISVTRAVTLASSLPLMVNVGACVAVNVAVGEGVLVAVGEGAVSARIGQVILTLLPLEGVCTV